MRFELTCDYLGERVPGPGLREWRKCYHPEQPLGNPVCPCKGCGVNCPGFKINISTNKKSEKNNRGCVYHIYPVSDTNYQKIWKWRLIQFSLVQDLFDFIVFGINYDNITDSIEDVIEYIETLFPNKNIDIVISQNSKFSEYETWHKLWKRAIDFNQDALVLRAHAKGVTRREFWIHLHDWATWLLTLTCFTDTEKYRNFPVSGPLRIWHGSRIHGGGPNYHFAGSWYWVNLKDSKVKDRIFNIHKDYYGVEGWCSRNFSIHEVCEIGPNATEVFTDLGFRKWVENTLRKIFTNELYINLSPLTEKLPHNLYIITPTNKIDLLLYQTLPTNLILFPNGLGKIKFLWIKDTHNNWGATGRNSLTKVVSNDENSWIYYLDDDNIIHPNLLINHLTALKYMPEKTIHVFSQQRENHVILIPSPTYDMQGKIDTANFIIKTSIMKKYKWKEMYTHDGVLFNEFLKNNENIGWFTWERSSIHNGMKWLVNFSLDK